ncbi:endonuclease/exonuclease/phosphatase family protein [Streptomyces sp. NPDC001407]|uniref:endonuclease/exonuclease/phosphatase family protein n=1 Tax=Streptomyces sp. NPDC001407 TaxID=3364573 RepID=UPI0036B76557
MTARGRRRRWTAAVAAVLAVLATLATNLTLSVTVAQAVNNDGTSPFVTYNMHGSDNGSRWTSEIRALAANNPLVALQEAGAGPPLPAHDDDRNEFRQIRLTPNRSPQPSSVQRVTWAGGPNGSNRYVYYLQTDPRRVAGTNLDTWDGGQMNLAFVTDTQANDVRVLENPAYNPDPNAPNNRYRARPLLGLRFGNTWYWNTHARGEDVPGLLAAVRTFAATDHRNWVLAGDFNVNILNRNNDQARNSLHLGAGETLLRTGQPTYINGDHPSELDYAITHGLPGGFTANRPGGAGSDHVPVLFGRTPPPAQQPLPSHVFRTSLATPTGATLRENPNGTVAVGPARYGSNETFQMFTNGGSLTHSLRNVATQHCISLAPSVRRDASAAPIVAGRCDDPRAQWTIAHLDDPPAWNDDNGGPQRWQNVAVPGLCLTPTGTSVTAAPCTASPAQLWWDNATSPPTGWQTTGDNIRLESSFLGGRLRRAGNVPGTDVYTQPTPPRSWWIYWLLWEKKDFGWNIQRISRDDNLVRIQSLDGTDQCLGGQDVHATTHTRAMLYKCDDARAVAGAGQRWLAEAYPNGSVRYRNEANHLCLLAPDGDHGWVSLYKCQDIPAERWNVVKP